MLKNKVFKQLKIRKVLDKDINKYLNVRNLKLNRIYSLNKKKINLLDHYIWWFQNDNRKSFIVSKNNKDLTLLFFSTYKLKKKKIIISGYMNFLKTTSIFELLYIVKWQNEKIDKIKGDKICVIIISKSNYFSKAHTKYFGYKVLHRKDKFFNDLSKITNFNNRFIIYTRSHIKK